MRLAGGAEVERLAAGSKITILFATFPPQWLKIRNENDAITPGENKQWRCW